MGFDESTNTLYVTDGSEYLHLWDATTLTLTSKVPVAFYTTSTSMDASSTSEPQLVASNQDNLNELEWDYHSGTVLSNVWKTDYIVRLDPANGQILTRYDLSGLPRGTNVLNGIAVTDEPNVLWVTGKLWPSMHKIRLIDEP